MKKITEDLEYYHQQLAKAKSIGEALDWIKKIQSANGKYDTNKSHKEDYDRAMRGIK